MTGETYKAAGVDRKALGDIKEVIHKYARQTYTLHVLSEAGLFSGMLRLAGYKDPVLAVSTDGVGTKLKVAVQMGQYESLGMDLVNLNINDVYTSGARPLLFLDYIGIEKPEQTVIEGLVRGMSQACQQAGCAFIGGETAQMPGTYQPGAFDFVGFVVGVVERDAIIDGSRVQPGDALLGVPSSGVHTNGFSLVRRVFGTDDNPSVLHRYHAELGCTLGEALLVPHRPYTPLLDPVLPHVKSMAHITGGGFFKNVPRVLPKGMAAHIRRGTWRELPIFHMLQESGGIDTLEMFSTFNMGLGMVLVVSAEAVTEVRKAVPEAEVIGEVVRQRDEQRIAIEGI